MPSSIAGESSVDERDSANCTGATSRKKRKRKRDSICGEMSPEEEAAVSPPAGLIAGREESQQRLTSPPSGSKFLHDHLPTRTDEYADDSCLESTIIKSRLEDDDATTDDDESRTEERMDFDRSDKSTDRLDKESYMDDPWGNSDVENFDGKIVYNPDGSAYIIEDSELSDDDGELPQLIGNGCIVDGRGVNVTRSEGFPQIANAIYVSSRNQALYHSLYASGNRSPGYQKGLQDKTIVPEVPVMHSYRVYTVRDSKYSGAGDKNISEAVQSRENSLKMNSVGKDCSSVPVKPILMCFICKLSFGYAKSFVAHAMSDHSVILQDDEKDILGHKNTSAIIQCVGKEKEPLVSFLEPLSPIVPPSRTPTAGQSHFSSSCGGTSESNAQKVPTNLVRNSSVGNGSFSSSDYNENKKNCAESLVMHMRDKSPHSNVQNQHVPETSVSLSQSGSSRNSNNFNINNSNNNYNGTNSNNHCVMDLTRKSPISGSGNNNANNSTSPGASPSPNSMMSPLLAASSIPFPQHPPNFLTGTTIGVCPDHMGGRPSGVDCNKCELILSSSRLSGVGGGPLAGMHSRNSCKTLKCPKCNWHYKYQETLEIHMKEKHPETETSCIYCIAGQPHPRLARGETYTCGYKPYRCEVCNYSTTTKGNLSIHMQSDKHLNNMQELQNGSVPSSELAAHQTPPSSQVKPAGLSSSPSPSASGLPYHHSPSQSQKPKPTFRCDVCNYETNVARNLRIHMTSEKHTHNMMVLQQNMKQIQALNAIQQSQQHQQQLSFEQLLHFHPGLTLPGEKPPPHSEAALADMAYNQALLIQLMTGGQLPPQMTPDLAPHLDIGLNPDTMEPPPEPADLNPENLYQCCVCNIYATDSLEALSHHLAADRTKIREQEILSIFGGHYVCKLCSYKTTLKANFQLHCKTDKHLQRLQHVNHVKEGGLRNEWKLKYVSSPGGVQVRCNACDYYTNSTHKLQLHVAAQRHDFNSLLFRHLRDNYDDSPKIYQCVLCDFSTTDKLPLFQHVRSMKHIQVEQIHHLHRRSAGKDSQMDIAEIFKVTQQPPDCISEQERKTVSNRERRDQDESKSDELLNLAASPEHRKSSSEDELNSRSGALSESESSSHCCPYCNYSTNSEMKIQAHILTQHSNTSEETSRTSLSPSKESFCCPLCQDKFTEKLSLEKHVMQIHSVNSEGLQRLLMLVDQSHWLNNSNSNVQQTPPNPSQRFSPSSSTASSSASKDADIMKIAHSDSFKMEDDQEGSTTNTTKCVSSENFECPVCLKSFKIADDLCLHQNENGHFDIKHIEGVSTFVCPKRECSSAYFSTVLNVQRHFLDVHVHRNRPNTAVAVSEKHVYKYRCNQCSLAFKTMEKLQIHSQYHFIREATKCVLCGRNFRSIIALQKHVETAHADLSEEEMLIFKQSLLSNPLLLAGLSGQVLDPSITELLKKESQRNDTDDSMDEESPNKDNEDNMAIHGLENSEEEDDTYREQFIEDYLNSGIVAEENYNDPNRKYKCHKCKVAFTRQSYLTNHNKKVPHRKGEKIIYPMEKYLDPNRPYKCEVCKESFTQKNILLVHYNSVSHLHKLKRASQELQSNSGNSSAIPINMVSSNSIVQTLTPKSNASSEDDDKKPYKCNICKVAYSQVTTLDIHMRSVFHQTRASKLQDLALSGQIDLTKPLIEQPDPHKVQEQRKKMNSDIYNSPSKLATPSSSSPITNDVSSQMNRVLSPDNTQESPFSSSTSATLTQTTTMSNAQSQHNNMISCQRCSALFISQEQLHAHQQLYCIFGNPMNIFPSLSANCAELPHTSPSDTALSNMPPSISLNSIEEQFLKFPLQGNKRASHMHQHLLQSFGFDLVKQFNENRQRKHRKLTEENERMLAELHSSHMVTEDDNVEESDKEIISENIKEEKEDEETSPEDLLLTGKSTCIHCNKEFSSIWVLKAHYEEVHRDLVPLRFLEKYAQQIKSEIEKKSTSSLASSTTTNTSVASGSNSLETVTTTSTNTKLSVMSSDTSPSADPSKDSSAPAITADVGTETMAVPQNSTDLEVEKSNMNTTSSTMEEDSSFCFDENEEKEFEDNKEAVQSKLASQHMQTDPSVTPNPPTACSTPGSSTESIPPNNSTITGPVMPNNPNIPMSLAQQMNEMQAALNVMAASQLQQQLQQFNPMMMGMAGLGMGLPLGLNMPALAAMNLQPPLVPMMMPPPTFDPMVSLGQAQSSLFTQSPGNLDSTTAMLAKQQQHLIQQQQAANASQQKRARTRITDDQLKILRAHFDINNSPSEEQINKMAAESGLPPKVIKHWFRNTLFKERQRNKDSPYNFNNPPSTTLNLEEYEKTGETKVMPLATCINSAAIDDNSNSNNSPDTPKLNRKSSIPKIDHQQMQMQYQNQQLSSFSNMHSVSSPVSVKSEPKEPPCSPNESHHNKFDNSFSDIESRIKREDYDDAKSSFFQEQPNSPPSPAISERMSTVPTPSSSPENLSVTSIFNSHHLSSEMTPTSSSMMSATSHSISTMLPPKLSESFNSPNQITSASSIIPGSIPRNISPARSNSMDCFPHSVFTGNCNSNGSNSSSSSGKRANRTRFTDYQIKVLQEFFENNAYPKDDDLEYLSKLLSLSPRVIVVWFQNARQKARKVYENQPPVEPVTGIDENSAGRFQRTPGLNYQCKKCLLVFQRYYELIRHQKTHCFKEEDAKRSAQAQAAAAQMAAVLSSEDSNSSTTIEQNHQCNMSNSSNPPTPVAPAVTPTPSQSYATSPIPQNPSTPDNKEPTLQCENCNLVFPRYDLWREHQLVHIMNPTLFPNYPPESPFGILQQHATSHTMQQQSQSQQQNQSQHQSSRQAQEQFGASNVDLSSNSNPPSPHPLLAMFNPGKRKYEEYVYLSDKDGDQPKDKRLRTTILPEQLDYLYQKYQVESNPSRKMLENIANEVGLKKRVVQVWFQNTRARERKGQFRAHSQVINKRCPFCPALFKVKSALESHLTTKHAEQYGRGEINIDTLPDEEASMDSTPSFVSSQTGDQSSKFSNFCSNAMIQHPLFSAMQGDSEEQFKKYYEESMRRYLSEIQIQQHGVQNGVLDKENYPTDFTGKLKMEDDDEREMSGECPLDLSKPMDLTQSLKNGPINDEYYSDSDCSDNMDDDSNPTSPASSTHSNHQQRPMIFGNNDNGKRYLSMNKLQAYILRYLFNDYKTPSVLECELLSREIGLPKRVVYMWFQSAQSREKSIDGSENNRNKSPDECKICPAAYSHKYTIQDHVFSKKHIESIKMSLENRMSKSELSGMANDNDIMIADSLDEQASTIHMNNNNNEPTQQQQQIMAQLQMLQMAGLGIPTAQQMMALATGKLDKCPTLNPDDVGLLQQLYGLGMAAGYPQNFVHSAGMIPSLAHGQLDESTTLNSRIKKVSRRQKYSHNKSTPDSVHFTHILTNHW